MKRCLTAAMLLVLPELFCACAPVTGESARPAALTFRVRPGAARGDGSRARPFGTFAEAAAAVRAARARAPLAGPAEIVLTGGPAEGPFTLGPADSGTEDSPLVIRSEPGTSLTGSRAVPPAAWREVPADRLARLAPAARAHVRRLDLAALGVPCPGKLPDALQSPLPLPELFADGRRMTLARWPNSDWALIRKIADPGTRNNDGSVGQSAFGAPKPATPRGGAFLYDGAAPASWRVAEGVYLEGFWCFDWASEVIRAESIDPAAQLIRLAVPHTYGLRQGNPRPRRWRAVNVFEELDEPGEYAVDLSARQLYFWPPDGLDRVRIGLRTEPVIRATGAARVEFRGLTIEEAQGDGIELDDCRCSLLDRCVIRNIRLRGIVVQGGSSNRVETCDIHDTGIGGVLLSGGDRRTLAPGRHLVEDSHIWDFSTHRLTYASAVYLAGVGNAARHNLIHGAIHMAVAIAGNDNLFEYNAVSNVCTASDDAAALYKGRNPSCRGNLIRYNYWADIGSPRGLGTAAIYFDDGDGGDSVIGNLFVRCGEPDKGHFGTIFSHGGHDIRVENCLFVDCPRALGSSPWDDKRWCAMLAADLWQKRLLKEVDITKPPYLTHYPELAGFMNPPPGTPRRNHAANNLFVGCGSVSCGNWDTNATDLAWTAGDPGFVNRAAGDYTLRPDSPALQALPAFRPLPFREMGLLTRRNRPEDTRR